MDHLLDWSGSALVRLSQGQDLNLYLWVAPHMHVLHRHPYFRSSLHPYPSQGRRRLMVDLNHPGSYAACLLHLGLTRLRLGTVGIDVQGLRLLILPPWDTTTSGFFCKKYSEAPSVSYLALFGRILLVSVAS